MGGFLSLSCQTEEFHSAHKDPQPKDQGTERADVSETIPLKPRCNLRALPVHAQIKSTALAKGTAVKTTLTVQTEEVAALKPSLLTLPHMTYLSFCSEQYCAKE